MQILALSFVMYATFDNYLASFVKDVMCRQRNFGCFNWEMSRNLPYVCSLGWDNKSYACPS